MEQRKAKVGDRTILTGPDGNKVWGTITTVYDEPTVVVKTEEGQLWVARVTKIEKAICLKAKELINGDV